MSTKAYNFYCAQNKVFSIFWYKNNEFIYVFVKIRISKFLAFRFLFYYLNQLIKTISLILSDQLFDFFPICIYTH